MKHRLITGSLSFMLAASLLSGAAMAEETNKAPQVHTLSLSVDGTASLDGTLLPEYDYVWHADPSLSHDEVKDCPAWYYTGEKPETDSAAYIARDIIYYPLQDETAFQLVNYDGEMEYVTYYTDEEHEDYIFSTLPVLGNEFPSQMMHSEEEAYQNPVIHIQEAGTYILEGQWNGQIYIDLGDKDDVFTDPQAKVTLILNGVDVNCSVAPALIFKNVYECDNSWEDAESHTGDVDTTDAGANVIIADGTVNNFTGANVFRLLKAKYKNDESEEAVKVQKKALKTDGSFYSYMSMNIAGEDNGSGILNITSTTFEGLDSELHLTINGGNINIYSQDDGINVNEDHVSVFTMNGGTLHVFGGLGAEGDGIDSNGFITMNGGMLVTVANPRSDNGMDSDDGTALNGGTSVILGSSMFTNDWAVYVDGEAQYGSDLGESSGGPGGPGGPDSDGGPGRDGGPRPPFEGDSAGDSNGESQEGPGPASQEEAPSSN